MEQFKYVIGDKTYIQRPLVLGQINQLMELMSGVAIPKDTNATTLMAVLGSRLPRALAIVLIDEEAAKNGMLPYLRTRELHTIAGEIAFNVSPETALQVVDDFFDCNPIASLFQKFGGLGEKIRTRFLNDGFVDSMMKGGQEA